MAKLRGATTLLRKPFSPPQLVAAIDRGLGLLPSAGESIQ
jgi:CheY-like chemotaxis protein